MIGLGGVTAGGATIGTSAFSSVQANRDVEVAVAGDSDAFLRIAPFDGPNGDYAVENADGTLGIDLSEDNEDIDGDGINDHAVTVFRNVFQIGNQGTQPVGVQITDPILVPEDGVAVGILPEGESPDEPIELETGDDPQRFSIVAAIDESINENPDLPTDTYEIVADAEVVE